MTGEPAKNFHEVGIGPLSKILAVKSNFSSLSRFWPTHPQPHNKGVLPHALKFCQWKEKSQNLKRSPKIPKNFIKFPSNRLKTLSGLFKSFSSKISNYLCPQNVMYIKELKKKSCDFSKNTNQPIFSQAKSVPYLVFVFTKLHLIFSFYPNTISQQDNLTCWNVKTVYTKYLNTD